jgi:hypothetical protein
VSTLLPLFAAAGISIDKFVQELWAGGLTDDALEEEIEKVKARTPEMSPEDLVRQFTVDE